MLLECCLQGVCEGRQLHDIAQLAPAQWFLMRDPQNVAAGRVDVDDPAVGIDRDQPGGEAARQRGGDAFQLVGARFLAIVQPLQFSFLRFERID